MNKVCRSLSFISAIAICCSVGGTLSLFTNYKIIQNGKWTNTVSLVADDVDDAEHKSAGSFPAIQTNPTELFTIHYFFVSDQAIAPSTCIVPQLFIIHRALRI